MLSVDEIIAATLRREGKFVNDPDDPGGATNHGVTIGTMRRLGIDIDGDGDIDVDDVRKLSIGRAASIYKKNYFQRPRINILPDVLQASVFDMYANAGSNAVKILQRVLRDMGFDIAVDGGIGSQTARIAHAALAENPDLGDAYGIARRDYYFRLADNRVQSRKYVRRKNGEKAGWIRRAEEFISPKNHMTDAQFKERISDWFV